MITEHFIVETDTSRREVSEFELSGPEACDDELRDKKLMRHEVMIAMHEIVDNNEVERRVKIFTTYFIPNKMGLGNN